MSPRPARWTIVGVRRRYSPGETELKLTSVRVTNYKCIEDSGQFSIADVTALVGKNESGKSALLEAMYKTNPVTASDGSFQQTDYPRRKWSEYKERRDKAPAVAIVTEWQLDDTEKKAVADRLGPKSLRSDVVKISRGYSNLPTWVVDVDEKAVVAHLIKTAKLPRDGSSTVKEAETVKEVAQQLAAIETPSEREQALKVMIEGIREQRPTLAAIDALAPHHPKFLYFTQYSRMSGNVSIDQLRQHVAGGNLDERERVFLALLDLVGTTPDELANITQFDQLKAELEAVSNRLTQEIFTYWSQNKHLEVEFSFGPGLAGDLSPYNSGQVFRTRIRNKRHAVTVGFDERSAGFVWFFSFLVWSSQMRKNFGDRLIILLDEPGLSLHAKAQADLLRYIDERLRPNYQVIYTTHSPFMINPENLLDTRTVEDVGSDGEVLGTRVGDKVFSTDADTLFPLQAALGYEITQSLFIGKDALLVEGPSDFLYLKWFSELLRQKGRTHLDARWVITPCGGVDKVGAFLTLFGGNKLHVAVLTDYAEGQKAKVRSLRESQLLRQGHVFTAENYTPQSEADIEDIIGHSNYLSLVNRCYGLTGASALPSTTSAGTPVRVLRQVQDHFATLPPEVPQFDHFTPAQYLYMEGGTLQTALPDIAGALARFEKLFTDLNALL